MHSNKYISAFLARHTGVVAAPSSDDPPADEAPAGDPVELQPGEVAILEDALAPVEQPVEAAPAAVIVEDAPEIIESAPAVPMRPTRLEFKNSTNLVDAVLDTELGIVTVQFKNGTSFRYGNFTSALMAEWEAASSAGSWFHKNIRSKPDRHPVVHPPSAEA